MKYFILIIELAILAGCGITESIVDQEDEHYSSLEKGNKVVVCHKNSAGNYNKIEISERALEAHLNHGDGQPGDAVPDNEGFIFTENCDCVPDCPGTVEYNGQIYNTVEIGDQCWLKENLNVGVMVDGSLDQTDNSAIEKYCYDDDPANCTTYGGLYQWNEAMQYSTIEGSQGICPVGWHIPTIAEYYTLITYVGGDGNALKEVGQGTGAGAGTNTSGFSALLAGVRLVNRFVGIGTDGIYWSSTEDLGTISAYPLFLVNSSSTIVVHEFVKKDGVCVRCVKD